MVLQVLTSAQVARVKNKWKCILKDGMIHINGKDYLFAKCTGYVVLSLRDYADEQRVRVVASPAIVTSYEFNVPCKPPILGLPSVTILRSSRGTSSRRRSR